MPRGRSKQAYGNRTDLNGAVPKAAPTGLPYGESKKLMDAQAAVPMASPELPPAPPVTQEAQAPVAPLEPIGTTSLGAPTEFPNESIGQGLLPQAQVDPDITRLKTTYLPLFIQEASNPNTPVMFREFVKWLNDL